MTLPIAARGVARAARRARRPGAAASGLAALGGCGPRAPAEPASAAQGGLAGRPAGLRAPAAGSTSAAPAAPLSTSAVARAEARSLAALEKQLAEEGVEAALERAWASALPLEERDAGAIGAALLPRRGPGRPSAGPEGADAATASAAEAALATPLGRELFVRVSRSPPRWVARPAAEVAADRRAALDAARLDEATRHLEREMRLAAVAEARKRAAGGEPGAVRALEDLLERGGSAVAAAAERAALPPPPHPELREGLWTALASLAERGADAASRSARRGGGLGTLSLAPPPPPLDARLARAALRAAEAAGLASRDASPPSAAAALLEACGRLPGGQVALLARATGVPGERFSDALEEAARRLAASPPPDPDADARADLSWAPSLALDDASTTEIDDAVGVFRVSEDGRAFEAQTGPGRLWTVGAGGGGASRGGDAGPAAGFPAGFPERASVPSRFAPQSLARVPAAPTPGAAFRAFVHVADPSRWIAPGSPLAAEARRRGTTYYLPGASAPMFPRSVAEGCFSLSQHEDGSDAWAPGAGAAALWGDRAGEAGGAGGAGGSASGEAPGHASPPTASSAPPSSLPPRSAMTVVADVSAEGELLAAWLGPSRIRPSLRLTYDDVDEALRAAAAASSPPSPLVQQLTWLEDLARARTALRVRRGAADFSLPEPYVHPRRESRTVAVDSIDQARSRARALVAEMMIMSGEIAATVAASVGRPEWIEPGSREGGIAGAAGTGPGASGLGDRTPSPDPARAFPYSSLPSVKTFAPSPIAAGVSSGVPLPIPYRGQPAAVPPDEASLRLCPEGPARAVLLRSRMLRGVAAADAPIRHAGLGVDAYTQFTSPIRRYGDLVAHWQLKAALRGAAPPFALAEVAGAVRDAVEAAAKAARLQGAGEAFWIARYFEGARTLEQDRLDARAADQGAGREAPGADQGAGREAPGADQGAGREAPGADQGAGREAPGADQGAGREAPGADQGAGREAPGADQGAGREAPGADERAGREAPRADERAESSAGRKALSRSDRAIPRPLFVGTLLGWAGMGFGNARVQLAGSGIEAVAQADLPATPGTAVLVACLGADPRAGSADLRVLATAAGDADRALLEDGRWDEDARKSVERLQERIEEELRAGGAGLAPPGYPAGLPPSLPLPALERLCAWAGVRLAPLEVPAPFDESFASLGWRPGTAEPDEQASAEVGIAGGDVAADLEV